MKLYFKSYRFGFILKSDRSLEVLKEDSFRDIALYIDILVTEKEEIAFVNWPFLKDPLKEIETELKYFKKISIPGLYDVPELGVKNATFVKVLEAVKKYYEKKLRRI